MSDATPTVRCQTCGTTKPSTDGWGGTVVYCADCAKNVDPTAHDFATAMQAATQAVTAVTKAASAHIAELLKDYPTIATLLVDTKAAIVDSCRDSNGQRVSYSANQLDEVLEKVDAVLVQVLDLGNDPDVLTRNGWTLAPHCPMAYFPVRAKADDRT
jgi:crotonobetainyl-CoA:carnitine CoA-transferase CaiB-like acyl-CoA transferase